MSNNNSAGPVAAPPSKEQKQAQSEQQKRMAYWLSMMVRGVTMRQPTDIRVYGHRTDLYVQAKLLKPEADPSSPTAEDIEIIDLVIENCNNYHYSPACNVINSDFGDEWPPRSLIQESLKPKIILPGGH